MVLNIDLKLQGPYIDLFPGVMLAPENFPNFFLCRSISLSLLIAKISAFGSPFIVMVGGIIRPQFLWSVTSNDSL